MESNSFDPDEVASRVYEWDSYYSVVSTEEIVDGAEVFDLSIRIREKLRPLERSKLRST